MENLFYKPFDSDNQEKIISEIIKTYPFVSKIIIGKSFLSKNIYSLKLGSDNKNMIIVGATHGSEWITSGLLLYFLNNVCKAISLNKKIAGININEVIKYKGFVVVPCLNPDGVDIAIHNSDQYMKKYHNKASGYNVWQANARGVDINHNFSAGFSELKKLEIQSGISSPSNSRFGGDFPESEPETKAITEYCRMSNFSHLISLHSQGEEIYWNYGDRTPEHSLEIANILSKSSGYKISAPSGIAVGGGLKDWFIQEFNKPAFTIEVGKGENPLPISDLFSIYERLEQMLVLSIII